MADRWSKQGVLVLPGGTYTLVLSTNPWRDSILISSETPGQGLFLQWGTDDTAQGDVFWPTNLAPFRVTEHDLGAQIHSPLYAFPTVAGVVIRWVESFTIPPDWKRRRVL